MASAPEFRLPQAPHFLFVCPRAEEEEAREAVASLFQQHRFDVAKDVKDAVQAVGNTTYDVIFIAEGVENGPDVVIAALRANQVAAPLVCLSAQMDIDMQNRCHGAGVDYMIYSAKLHAFLMQHMRGAGFEVKRTLILDDAPRILVIDDMPHDLKIVLTKAVIEAFYPNAVVVVVETGDEAQKALSNDHFNLVLIDYNLGGGVKGDAVAVRLRKHHQTTYFVGFSSDMEDAEKRARCLQAGMDDAIIPNELAELLQRCNSLESTTGE
jgi:DNA-binding response OmpR family regulator